MKRYLLALISITFIVCLLLHFIAHYNWLIILYHAIVMGVIYGGVLIGNSVLLSLPINRKIKNTISLVLNGIFFFSLIVFYLATISSNILWKKTITFSILSNYLLNLWSFLDIVPVEKWLILAILLLFLSAITLLFVKIVPTQSLDSRNDSLSPWIKKIFLLPILILFTALLFADRLLKIKRIIHFAEEPLLQFVFGGMWGGENNLAFDQVRFANGLKDSTCIESIIVRQPTRNVVLILIDGLRVDHLSTYGYHRKTAPFLDSLQQSGNLIKIKHAFSPSTMTIGGIAGMFFSKDWTDFGFNGLSLMKFMQRSGYKTYAFLTGFHRDWYGLSALYRGSCDYYYESSKNPEIKNDDDFITLREFKKTPINNGSFVYIHLLSVHTLGKRNTPFRKYQPDKISFSAKKEIALVNNYDNGVLQADFVIKQIFQKLKNENLLDNSTIIITSDHGEMLGEDDTWGHGGNIHQALISVPLLIFDQQRDWYKNTEIATLKDIPPTVAARIGSNIPNCWEGFPLNKTRSSLELTINSVEECSYPFGNLFYNGNIFKLEVMDNRQQIVKEETWHP